MKTKNRSAFTLIEIMIVVAIIGLLAAIAIPNINEAIATSRAQACQLNRKNIDAAKLRWSVANNQPMPRPRSRIYLGATPSLNINPTVQRVGRMPSMPCRNAARAMWSGTRTSPPNDLPGAWLVIKQWTIVTLTS